MISAAQTLRDITSVERNCVGILHGRLVADEGKERLGRREKVKSRTETREGVESQPSSCSIIAREAAVSGRGCSTTLQHHNSPNLSILTRSYRQIVWFRRSSRGQCIVRPAKGEHLYARNIQPSRCDSPGNDACWITESSVVNRRKRTSETPP